MISMENEDAPHLQMLVERYLDHPTQETKHHICKALTPLVRHWAYRFSKTRDDPFDDYVAVGNHSVLKALRDFDPLRGAEFGAYASSKIRSDISHHIRDKRHIIRIPAYIQEFQRRRESASARFIAKHQREATNEELSSDIGMDCIKFEEYTDVLRGALPLKEVIQHQDSLDGEAINMACDIDGQRANSSFSYDDRSELMSALELIRRWRTVERRSSHWIVKATGMNPTVALSLTRSIDANTPFQMA